LNGVTPVKDQFRPHGCDTCYRYCGSCYAFAACAQLESFIKIYDAREEDLSEQQILSCRSEPTPPDGPGGCYGGNATLAYNTFLDPGAVAETCMVYEADHSISCTERECSIHGRISGYSIVENDINSLKLALQSGPVWIDMYSCDDFKYFYHSGSFTYPPDVHSPPNHAMLLVGWNDTLTVCDSAGCKTIGSWIIKNSWGSAWGYEGYGYVQYGTPTFAKDAFQIQYTRSPVTRLYVREPNGGQVWAAGSRHKILWRSGGVAADHFEAGYYSGGRYNLINGAVDPAASELLWTIPADAAGTCRVKIAALGMHGEILGDDTSDASFDIIEPRTEWDASGAAAADGDTSQEAPLAICDNAGGAIIVWKSARAGAYEIFAQRFDGPGNRLWPSSGVRVCAITGGSPGVQIIPDRSGGAFLVWEDPAEFSIQGQKLSSNGSLLAQGIPICGAPGTRRRVQLASDEAGGAFVVWEDGRDGGRNIYAQRIYPGGACVWQSNGVPISTGAEMDTRPQIAADGSGGAIIVWIDGSPGSQYLYAQHVDPWGGMTWRLDGVVVCPAYQIHGSPRVVPDRNGGAVIVWLDESADGTSEIRAQKISSNGKVPWPETGVAVCPAAMAPQNVDQTTDGLGGVIVVWDDGRGEWLGQVYPPVDDIRTIESQRDVYAQRIGTGGNRMWAAGGVPIASLPRTQEVPRVTYDGTGGAIIVWSDKRDSRWIDTGDGGIPDDEDNRDIFGQRIDALGNIMWRENGEPLCADFSRQCETSLTAVHGSAVFVAWEDFGAGGRRIFAQKIDGTYSAYRCSVAASIRRNGSSYPVSSTPLFACPQGDRPDTLKIECRFTDESMMGPPAILPSDIELVTNGLGFSFCDSAAAGTPGTPANGSVVTLLRCHAMGCGACAEPGCSNTDEPKRRMPLRYSGRVIGYIEGLRVRSIDVLNDGIVNALENEGLGSALNTRSADPGYRRCYDFDADGSVSIDDFSTLGAHYGHGRPTGPSRLARAAPAAGQDVGLVFAIRRPAQGENPDKLFVTIFLENAHALSSLCFGLNNEIHSLTYHRWTSVQPSSATFPAAPVMRDAHAILFIAGYNLRTIEGPLVEIGTIEYGITGSDTTGGGAGFDEDDLFVVFGDFVDANGRIGRIAGARYEEDTRSYPTHLWGCYPNPFNPKTTIRYSIKERGPVVLRIYTVAGQLVRTLVNDTQDPRASGYSVQWDGRNKAGAPVSSGVYFCRFTAGNFSETKKMVLLR
jgi:hypothetical protein